MAHDICTGGPEECVACDGLEKTCTDPNLKWTDVCPNWPHDDECPYVIHLGGIRSEAILVTCGDETAWEYWDLCEHGYGYMNWGGRYATKEECEAAAKAFAGQWNV